MYTADWVAASSFQARPESAIHFLLHLSVPPLHCTQIPVAGVVPLDLRAEIYLKYSETSALGEVTASLSTIYCGKRTSTEEAAPPPTPILYTGPPIFTTSIPDRQEQQRSRGML